MDAHSRYASSITTEEISELPVASFRGRTFLVDDAGMFERVLPLLESKSVLGFDTETKPSFKKGKRTGVSLLQLADASEAFLFRLNKIGLPDELKSVLEDPSVLKIGVAVHDDLRALERVRRFNPVNFLDLQKYTEGFRIEDNSLRKLAAIVLKVRISKSQQLSDWESPVLSEAQKSYAATDAWVCREIYHALRHDAHP